MTGTIQTTEQKLEERFPDMRWQPMPPAARHPMYNYKGFHPDSTSILPVGHKREPKYRAFGVDTYFHQDVPVKMRDGVTLRVDIFRPVSSDDETIPTIIPYSGYGKTGSGMLAFEVVKPITQAHFYLSRQCLGVLQYDFMAAERAGIPWDRTSGYEKFEVRPVT